MDELFKKASQLRSDVEAAAKRIDLYGMEVEVTALHKRMQQPDFWLDSTRAGQESQRQAQLEQRLAPWHELLHSSQEVIDLLHIGDSSMQAEIAQHLAVAEQQFALLKADLRFTGPYDDHNAIINLYAGAGGTDAQDWTQMLLRMYSRWADKNGYKIAMVEQSAGEEAGLKSATLQVIGPMAYGKLRGEHGVHRLVRLSPFNSSGTRETSFAKVDILPQIDKPEDLNLDDKDLKIDVYRAGGHGGQSVNTTDSAVRITHLPTGLTVAIQNERSQLQNKELAMTILRSRLAQLQMEQHLESLADLKGPNQSAEWGNQIRSYVLHPYTMVKDNRSGFETSNVQAVLDGDLNGFIEAFLEHGPTS